MIDLFSHDVRRDPYPAYDRLRAVAPVFREPATGLWLVTNYDGVKRVLSDPEAFSSRYGPDWLIFTDPPRHTKLRALVSKAFTPRSVATLEPRIRSSATTSLPMFRAFIWFSWGISESRVRSTRLDSDALFERNIKLIQCRIWRLL